MKLIGKSSETTAASTTRRKNDEVQQHASSNNNKKWSTATALTFLMAFQLIRDNRTMSKFEDLRKLLTTAATTTDRNASFSVSGGNDKTIRRQRYDLRFDWRSLPIQSELSKTIEQSQTLDPQRQRKNKADLKFWKFQATKYFGLGASLHVWAQHICNSMEAETILLWRDHWNWNYCQDDHKRLGFQYDQRSCYFQNDNLTTTQQITQQQQRQRKIMTDHDNRTDDADDDDDLVPKNEHDPRIRRNTGINRWGLPKSDCPNVMKELNATLAEFRAASMEWLFSHVHDRVIDEARRQIREAFGDDGLPDPDDMVTVHVRWGDKKTEIDLAPIEEYINATKAVTADRGLRLQQQQTNRTLHVYLATEDQDAIEQFRAHAPPDWQVHTSGPITPKDDNSMTKFASGKAALESLGALLLSLESNYFVLTLASNWSMLINELRLNVVNARCGDCTRMVNITGEIW